MKKLSGIAVSPGIAIGDAIIKKKKKILIARKFISPENKTEEKIKFYDAVRAEISELENFISRYTKTKEDKELLNSHKTIMTDPMLSERIEAMIEKDLYTSENALYQFFLELSTIFGKISNDYLSERIVDYEDVIFKLITRLTGEKDTFFEDDLLSTGDRDLILVMEDITPTDVTKSYHSNVRGICLRKGSKTSHSAIIARALGLPVVVGIHNFFSHASDGDTIIVDGSRGEVIIEPDSETSGEYRAKLEKEKEQKKRLEDIINIPSRTKDGKEISLLSNIELEQEVDTIIASNTAGIGLFRTEFLYVDRDDLPDEEEQYHVYSRLAGKLEGKQLIIRTFDLGGDKLAKVVHTQKENNPYLGCRGIRLSLRYPGIFKTQVRAILRAGVHGNVAMMFPMVASVTDMKKALAIVEDCKKELESNKIEFDSDIKIGVMIEVPAAVLCGEELAEISDFFSIGTNDLVQYTLAADRNSETVAEYYDPYHPAIFKLIAITVSTAHRYGKKVSVCGEIAAEPDFICLLLGLGVDSLSVNPNSHLTVKEIVLECNYEKMKGVMKKILKMNTGEEVSSFLSSLNVNK